MYNQYQQTLTIRDTAAYNNETAIYTENIRIWLHLSMMQ